MANPLDEAFAELDADIEAARNPPRVVPPRASSKAPSPKAPAKPASLMDQAKGALKAFQKDPVGQTTEAMKGVNASIIRAPGQLAGGLVDTSADVGIFIGENIDAGLIRAGQRPVFSGKRVYGAALADTLSMRSTVGQYGNQAVNQFSTEAVASLLPVTKALGAGKAATRLALAGGGAAASMETKEGDAVGRAKNALIGAAAEGGGELIIRGGAAVLKRVIKPGTPAEAAKDSLDRAFATRRTADARATQADAQVKGEPVEVAPQEELPAGTRKGDTSMAPQDALIDDANDAIRQAGGAEQLTPETMNLGPDGKIRVAPETKAALDEAGFGRAFASREDDLAKDAVIFKEEAEDGSSRVVGAMGREDLTNFGADVAHLRDNPGDINLEAGSPHGQWKMAHLGAPYDAASVLRAIVESVPSGGRKLTDGELMEQAAAAADALGQSPAEALSFARQLATDQTDAATALKAVQTIWTRMGTDLDGISRDVDWATAPEDLVEQARRSIHDLQMFSVAMEESKSGAGAALRTLGLPDADTYLAAARRVDRGEAVVPTAADNPPPLPRTRDELKDWVSMWDALKDNPAGRAQFLKGLRTYPSGSFYLRTAFANFFTGAILSAPKTILLNIAQPAFMGGLRTLERTAGAAMGSINPMLSATQRAEFRTIAAQAPISYVQTIGDIADAFKGAARAFADNQSPLGGANPLDFTTGGIPQAMIEAAERDGTRWTPLPYHLGNLLNYLPRAVFRLHGTTNEVALHMAYMGEVRAKAMLEAAASKLAPADAQALVRTRLSEASSNLDGSATDAASLDSATRTTMVRQPNEEFTPGVASFERTIQAWRKNLPELRFVLPIFQVPANAMGETLRRIPGVNFLMKETVEELSGSLGAFRKAEAYGRMTLGAGFLTAGVMMARNGLITGAGPQDPQDKALWLQTHQPYSFRAGDQWVAYDRMDPVGPLFAIAAGYFDTSVYRDTDRDMTLSAVGALAQYFKDKSALQGVSDVLNFGGDPRDQSTFMRRLGGTVGGFVPAFLQVPRAMADSGMNVKRNPWDYIVDRLPGASLALDPLRNLLGEPVHKPQDTLVENLLPVTMSPISDYATEPVLDELDRLYNMTGYTPGMLSPAGGPQAHFDMRDVKLENGGSLYNQLMRARTTSTIDGVTLKQALHELFESDEYNEASDGTGSVNDLEGGPREDTRGGMVQKVFTAYTAQTKIDVATGSPIAARWLAVAKIKSDANQALRGIPAEDLVENPSLLEALGIDVTAYEATARGEW